MTKSRSLRIGMALAVSAVLAACSSTAATTAPTATPTQAPAVTPAPTPVPSVAKVYTYKDMTVGFIQTGSESAWRIANTTSFNETAKTLGLTLKFYDAQGKLENQVSAFHQFVQDPAVNVIVMAALDVTGYDAVLQEAKTAGKIVVLEDRRINADSSMYYTYIGSDFDAEGQKGAAAMCDLLKGSAKKNIAEISGAVGASAGIDRAKGFREKLQCADGPMTVTMTQTGNWGVPESKAVMEAFLKKTHDIQGVYAHNDEEAIGALQAITEAGLKPGKDIKIVTFDATADGFKYMITGEINADIECNPLLAPQVYEAALKALNGDTSLPKWIPSQEGQFFAAQGADALKAILATRKY